MPLAKLLFLPVVALLAVEIQVAAAELPLGMKTGIERFAQTHSGISAEPAKAPIGNLPLSILSVRNWWVRLGRRTQRPYAPFHCARCRSTTRSGSLAERRSFPEPSMKCRESEGRRRFVGRNLPPAYGSWHYRIVR